MITVPGSIPKIILLCCFKSGYFWCKVQPLDKSIKIFINWVLGPLLFVVLTWGIVRQVSLVVDWKGQLISLILLAKGQGLGLLLLTILMMLLHWAIEAVKWRELFAGICRIKWRDAFLAVFSGLAISLLTPNRTGEFAGRIIYLPDDQRLKGTAFTVVSNLAQLVVTLCAGSFALLFQDGLVDSRLASLGFNGVFRVLYWLAPSSAIVVLVVYFKGTTVMGKLWKIRLLSRFRKQISALDSLTVQTLFRVLFWSFLRYLIFIMQYWVLLMITNQDISFTDLSILLAIMFLWLAIIPTFSIAELGLRWQFALWLFAPLGADKLGILFAVSAVWFINFVLAAILGTLAVSFYKPFAGIAK
jgi:uncharacterized membrane protein YbhN (UPF0104 family)